MNRKMKTTLIVSSLVIIGALVLNQKTKNMTPQITTKKEVKQKSKIVTKRENKLQAKFIKKAEKKNDQLVLNETLRSKAIESKEDRQKLDNYLGNSRNIRIAYLTLRSMNFKDLEESMEKRINATNFLIDGLKRKHMNREEIMKATEMFLLSEQEDETSNLDERKLIIGDKVDLFHALLNFAPEEASRFKKNYMSERLKKVIKYVELNTKGNRG